MRLRTFLATTGMLVAFGVVGFRIIDLEQRVALLTSQNERQEVQPTPAQAPSERMVPGIPSSDYDSRLRTIEQRIAALENMKDGIPMPSGNIGEDRLKQEQAILSVVERENSRIREVQLEWHKARWLETRKQQLAVFAFSQKLDPGQTTRIYQALETELNGLADVMKRPSFAEEPDQAANEWLNVLAETDRSAQATLSPAQYQTWVQGRTFERKVLWPWLPDVSPETAQK